MSLTRVIPVEELEAGVDVFVSPRIGFRPVLRVTRFEPTSHETRVLFDVVYRPLPGGGPVGDRFREECAISRVLGETVEILCGPLSAPVSASATTDPDNAAPDAHARLQGVATPTEVLT